MKTVERVPNVSSNEVNTTVKEFYKNEIWEEHSLLADKYPGFSNFIEWGRKFIEDYVLPEIKKKNDEYLEGDKNVLLFWVHKKPLKESKCFKLAMLYGNHLFTL